MPQPPQPPRLTQLQPLVARLVEGKAGLEVGGPSEIFGRRGLLPVYPAAALLDNCNFSSETVWEGHIRAGRFTYDPRRAPGRQHIAEGARLSFAADASYDFLLSSHTLEHSANPLQCLHEWRRVLRPASALVLVLPHKDGTFDHHRPVTPLEHLVDDFERGTQEDDLTHLPEILALHDLTLDPGAGSREQFAARSRANLANRCLHQHVFDTHAAVALADQARLSIRAVEPALPHHILIIALSTAEGGGDNTRFLSPDAAYRSLSPFSSDRPTAAPLRN
jgi:SAM-dependent methyltransferase